MVKVSVQLPRNLIMEPPKTYAETVNRPKMGRPTDYSDELADKICEEIGGGSNLSKLGKLDEFPARGTMMRWLNEHPYFDDNYTRARENRADYRVDKLDEIGEDLRNGVIDHKTARVESDNIKWQAGKEKPKIYGDASLVKLADANGENLKVATIFVTPQEAADAYAAAIKEDK